MSTKNSAFLFSFIIFIELHRPVCHNLCRHPCLSIPTPLFYSSRRGIYVCLIFESSRCFSFTYDEKTLKFTYHITAYKFSQLFFRNFSTIACFIFKCHSYIALIDRNRKKIIKRKKNIKIPSPSVSYSEVFLLKISENVPVSKKCPFLGSVRFRNFHYIYLFVLLYIIYIYIITINL